MSKDGYTIFTKEDVKDVISSAWASEKITNDYCSDEILGMLEKLGVINMFEAGYTYAHNPYITHQVVLKWLRNKYKQSVEISATDNGRWLVCVYIIGLPKNFHTAYVGTYDTYEQTVEAALMSQLKKLSTLKDDNGLDPFVPIK